MSNPPEIPLTRRRHTLAVHDEAAVQTWLLEQVQVKILHKGQPHPRIIWAPADSPVQEVARFAISGC